MAAEHEEYDPSVARLTTPEECAQFIENVADKHPDLAAQARRRGIELRAAAYGATGAAEREALEAVYAYEEVLSAKRLKRTHASRTWQMIKRHGIIGAVERAVDRPDTTTGYQALVDMGLKKYAFEAVVLRHPALFSPETVRRSEERMAER